MSIDGPKLDKLTMPSRDVDGIPPGRLVGKVFALSQLGTQRTTSYRSSETYGECISRTLVVLNEVLAWETES